jgi:hypothetical protein
MTPLCAFRSILIFSTPHAVPQALRVEIQCIGQIWPTHGIFMAFFSHALASVHGGFRTPLCAFRSTLIFSTPVHRATGLTRQDTVSRVNLAHAWNFFGLLCPCSCLNTWRFWDASVCFSEHFDFFDPRALCHGLNASRYDALGKFCLRMEFSWPSLHMLLPRYMEVV